jgi:hypothetical protein
MSLLSAYVFLTSEHCGNTLEDIEEKTDPTLNYVNTDTFFYLIFTTLIISAKTPAAVTSAPAPYPLIIIGYSL